MVQMAGASDFNFLVGTWHVRHRRLREQLVGSDEWEVFEGMTVDRTVLAGMGNVDENTMERASGHREGMTVRLYDPATQLWSLYWSDSVQGVLQPPVVGRFTDGRGEFYSRETIGGQSIICRFIWSDITSTSCRWEQAFSINGGKTWEVNWIMEFTRQQG
jgi:hypothetical protein